MRFYFKALAKRLISTASITESGVLAPAVRATVSSLKKLAGISASVSIRHAQGARVKADSYSLRVFAEFLPPITIMPSTGPSKRKALWRSRVAVQIEF